LLDEAANAEKKQEFIVLLNPNQISQKHPNAWRQLDHAVAASIWRRLLCVNMLSPSLI
jgi:hypothetical protein